MQASAEGHGEVVELKAASPTTASIQATPALNSLYWSPMVVLRRMHLLFLLR